MANHWAEAEEREERALQVWRQVRDLSAVYGECRNCGRVHMFPGAELCPEPNGSLHWYLPCVECKRGTVEYTSTTPHESRIREQRARMDRLDIARKERALKVYYIVVDKENGEWVGWAVPKDGGEPKIRSLRRASSYDDAHRKALWAAIAEVEEAELTLSAMYPGGYHWSPALILSTILLFCGDSRSWAVCREARSL